MFNTKSACLMLMTLLLVNCTYTILENRHKELSIIEEQSETVHGVYNPVVIIQPTRPPERPVRPNPPIKPDPVINEPIKEIIQPGKEDLNKKRDFDKRQSTDMIKDRNPLKREKNR